MSYLNNAVSEIEEPEKQNEASNEALAAFRLLGEITRVYLCLFNDELSTMGVTHEWCASEIKPQKNRLRDVPLTSFPWWTKNILAGDVVMIKKTAMLPITSGGSVSASDRDAGQIAALSTS